MRISDWSSDVCSSDIQVVHPLQGMQFDASGNLVPFQFGELYNTAKPSTLMVGGDPSITDYYSANGRSEEHTSELQSLMRISYAVFCLKKKNNIHSLYSILPILTHTRS